MRKKETKTPGQAILRYVVRAAVLSVFISLAAGFLSGCSTVEPPDSNMPWAQPAEWEKENILRRSGVGF